MKTIRNVFWVLLAGCFAGMWAGCQKGPLEKAGSAVDKKIDDIKR